MTTEYHLDVDFSTPGFWMVFLTTSTYYSLLWCFIHTSRQAKMSVLWTIRCRSAPWPPGGSSTASWAMTGWMAEVLKVCLRCLHTKATSFHNKIGKIDSRLARLRQSLLNRTGHRYKVLAFLYRYLEWDTQFERSVKNARAARQLQRSSQW